MKRGAFNFGLFACALAPGHLANAEEAGGGPPIVVTAQGRPELSQDVQSSVQVFAAEDLAARDLNDLRKIAQFVPGLTVDAQYPTTPSIVIRGISSDTADLTAEPRVAIFQDGVYVSRPQSALFELYDIERVEVIKGPQSTLFGRAALTGALSIVQNKAEPGRLHATARAGAGTLGSYVADGAVNVPISAAAAFRLAGLARNRDGYVANLGGGRDLNGNRVRALRAAVHVDLPGGGEADLIVNAQRDRFTGLSYKSGVFAPTDPVSGAPLGDLDPASPAYLSAAPDFERGDLGGKRRLEGVTALYDQPLGNDWSLAAVGGWTRFRAQFVGDVDGFSFDTATTGEITQNEQWSGELRLKYQPSDALFAFVGANVADESGSQDILLQVDERDLLALQTGFLDRTRPVPLPEAAYAAPQAVAGQLQAIGGASGLVLDADLALALAGNLLGDHAERLRRTADNSYVELFGGVQAAVAPRVSIELGVRYTGEEKHSGVAAEVLQRSVIAGFLGAIAQPAAVRDALLQALAIPGAPFIPAGPAYPLPAFGLLYQQTPFDEARLDGSGFSWRVSALYRASPDLNIYAAYARGRRPEVLSPQPASIPGGDGRFASLASETVDSLELGAKYRGGPVRLDAAVFHYSYRHFQTEVLQGTALVSLDAGEADAIGAELSAAVEFSTGTSVFANYGYTRARFGAGAYEGNHVRLSPDHVLSVGANTEFALASGRFSVTPTLNWRSRVYLDNSNGELSGFSGAFLKPLPFAASQEGYALAALHLGYEFDRLPLRLQAHLENLFDKRYVSDIGTGSVAFGLPSYVAAAPRTFMLSALLSLGDR